MPLVNEEEAIVHVSTVRNETGQQISSWVVQSLMPVQYTVFERDHLFENGKTDILIYGSQHGDASQSATLRRFIVIDETVDKYYGDEIRRYLHHHRVEARILSLPSWELHKTMDAVFRITEELNTFGISRRREPIIGIGGGVLLDIVGLTASLYRRGTPYIRVPTTLLGLVDAGIGIKTGVNFQRHKNQFGSYFAPLATFLDKSFLRSLDQRQLSNGLAEILKMAIIKDGELFALLEQHGSMLLKEKFQEKHLSRLVIRRAVQGMLEELEANLWEHNLYRIVDFGHTFSPSIEMQALPALLHGEAVTLDMALSVMLAEERKLLCPVERDRILRVMQLLSLPIIHPLCEPEFLYRALQETMKHRDGLQRLPLPSAIGTARFFNDITLEEVRKAAYALRQWEREKGSVIVV